METMSRHFEAFDRLRDQGFFIGEFIWNFADFRTAQSKSLKLKRLTFKGLAFGVCDRSNKTNKKGIFFFVIRMLAINSTGFKNK